MRDIFAMRSVAIAAVCWALLASPAAADDEMKAELPDVHTSAGVSYITGGIGDEERSYLEAVRKEYNLHIMSAGKSGEFTGDTRIRICNGKGDELINATAGPLFYARLPAGSYAVEATNEGQSRKQAVRISAGKSSHIHFGW